MALAVLRIRIRMFLDLLDPDPLVRGTGPALIRLSSKNSKKTLISTALWLYDFFMLNIRIRIRIRTEISRIRNTGYQHLRQQTAILLSTGCPSSVRQMYSMTFRQRFTHFFSRLVISWLAPLPSTVGTKIFFLAKILYFVELPLKNYFSITKCKASRTRNFQLQVFSRISLPRAPEHPDRTFLNSFRKFTEMFAKECLSAVSTTPVINEKNFEV